MELQFAEPTGRSRPTNVDREIAEALRANPGKWAIIEEVPLTGDEVEDKKTRQKLSNRASLIRRGRLKTYPKGVFDAQSSSADKDEDGVPIRDEQGRPLCRVYAVYNGKEAEDAALAALEAAAAQADA